MNFKEKTVNNSSFTELQNLFFLRKLKNSFFLETFKVGIMNCSVIYFNASGEIFSTFKKIKSKREIPDYILFYLIRKFTKDHLAKERCKDGYHDGRRNVLPADAEK